MMTTMVVLVFALQAVQTLELHSATPSATSVPCYGRLDLNLDLKSGCANPFDPAEIAVYAEFVSPDGKRVRVNGFYYQPCSGKAEKDVETIEPDGAAFWQIRFSPNLAGAWRYQVFAKDRSGEASLPESGFEVTASTSAGFVRRNTSTPNLFMRDNGQPYIPIGENMCWGRLYDYDQWLPALGQAGGNWIRLWTFRWNCGLEWTALDRQSWDYGTFDGLGKYNLCSAWRLDRILDTADQNGVSVMLCLGTYGEFTTGGFFNEGMWNTNPYNAANGGPCAKPEDFWTDERARQLYKQRLRYISARYGWRTNVFAWEFWNEAHAPAAWVKEMAQYLKGTSDTDPADPFGHLVSTTYGDAEVWNLPEVDFTQSHLYGEANIPDAAPVIHDDAQQHLKYGKPHFAAEFGIDWRSSDDKQDTVFAGVNLHNAMWASILSGNAGGAMIWYWDTYVHPGRLYPQFATLRRFVDKAAWMEGPWKPVEADPPEVHLETETWRDLVSAPTAGWGKSLVPAFTISALNGAGNDPLPTFLYGSYKPELRVPIVLKTRHERPWRFDLVVNSVCTMVRVQFSLDGAVVREMTLSAVPPEKGGPKAEYESTELRNDYPCYQARFNKAYGIDVPAGEHTLMVDVVEGDWLSVTNYTFSGYVSNRYPRMNHCGMTNGRQALVWLQHADHNWRNVKANTVVEAIKGACTMVHGLPAGPYVCEWFDPWKGEVIQQVSVVASAEGLSLADPNLTTDIAVWLHPE